MDDMYDGTDSEMWWLSWTHRDATIVMMMDVCSPNKCLHWEGVLTELSKNYPCTPGFPVVASHPWVASPAANSLDFTIPRRRPPPLGT